MRLAFANAIFNIIFIYYRLLEKLSTKNRSLQTSPDWSGNPFCGVKRNKKIGTESGTELSTSQLISASNYLSSQNKKGRHLFEERNSTKVVGKNVAFQMLALVVIIESAARLQISPRMGFSISLYFFWSLSNIPIYYLHSFLV